MHDQELTYSLAVSSKTRFSRAGTQLVANVHQALTRALAQWNIAVTLHGPLPSNGPRDKSFLCFQRRAAEDVVLAEHKICGSALRQRRCATLLHGSVLVGASRYAAELPGINDLAGRPVVGVDLREAWTQELATALELSLEHDALTAGEQQRARQLESRRYATEAWTQKR